MRAIIFDLDGTLWDATRQIACVWNALAKEFHIEKEITPIELHGCMGKNIDVIFDMLYPNASEGVKEAFLELCEKEECIYLSKNGGNIYPHVIEGLKALQLEHKLYIVSNCQKGYIEAFLAFYQIADLFSDYECSGNTGMVKSENIKRVIQRNHLDECLYVGDTEGDRIAARDAKIDFVHILHGFGQVTEPCQTVEDFKHLVTFLTSGRE